MCGIAGFLSLDQVESIESLQRMVQAIRYRGPDDRGAWADPAAGIALGHARLSILDLSANGHQPMQSGSGRYVISYNGEIYNFAELKTELEPAAHRFRGHSDTEVLLAAIEQWGVEVALQRADGMFAFALWDRDSQALTLARDRLGEKPLYYGWLGNQFLFGSELKALRAFPSFDRPIDRRALTLLLRYNCIPAPYSIYDGIAKLPPGHWLTLSRAGARPGHIPGSRPYWSFKEQVELSLGDPFQGNEEEAIQELDRRLRRSIRNRMVADVPVGAFLSGGIDSSAVVALMQAQSTSRVRTFTIGYSESAYNEAPFAQQVARHLRTDHTELYVTPEEAMAVIPRLPSLYDEPFADASQIPTALVAELARRHVTVALSGDGGDELFGGYNRYFWGRTLRRRIGWIPPAARPYMARAIRTVSPQGWDRWFGLFGALLPSIRLPADKLYKLADMLEVGDLDELYLGFVSHWMAPAEVVIGGKEPATLMTERSRWALLRDFTQRMMYLDTLSYLPDDLLVKVDRATMAVGLEARIPFLDHELVQFAWRLPQSWKIRSDDQGKYLLRRMLCRYVPPALFERPKMGFGVPIDSWLRGPLREWAEDLLDEARLRREGYFHPEPIREKWRQHLSGTSNWHYHLWDVLMFQAWLSR